MNLYKMTKEELILTCKRLYSENEKLQYEVESLSECYYEMENKVADILNSDDRIIKDVSNFKYKLAMEDLLTPEIESFIDNYLRFYNQGEVIG